ncbi:MAG TPA: glycosyl hydrolase family 8 [Cellvibrio sp.]|nr:glycosyl hydrolase family 8 [Cellvibrio sp.]
MLKLKTLGIAVTMALAASAMATMSAIAADAAPSANAKQASTALRLDDGAGAYKTGRYANLFVERLNKTPAETRARIEQSFQKFFHGDGQEERVYFETGANENGPLAYITDWANNDARSEGLSYGMMIAVQLDKKREFDALWNWSKTYMNNTDPKNPSRGYFAWSMNTDGTPRSTSAAPDGEMFYAMSLYFAANRWGNGKGIYNYKNEADIILKEMRHHGVLTGTTPFRVHANGPLAVERSTRWPSPNNRTEQAKAIKEGKPWPPVRRSSAPREVSVGPMVDEEHAMIRFVPETNLPGTDPSYHLPAFYELWARWAPKEERAFWARAAEASRNLFHKAAHPETGLSPDRTDYDGTPSMGWDGKPSIFAYDSWRTVSNMAVDYSWFKKDPRQTALSDRYQNFLFKEGIKTFADKYTLDGKPASDRHSVGMLAAAAAGSLAATPGEVSNAFLQEFWDTPMPVGEQRYFDGMLYIFNMMHLSGEFRVIEPAKAVR